MYRLRKGEALYSAVVVRFTGRLDAIDVNDLAMTIAARSGIENVHAIPVGFPVKIPMEFLTAEFLPKDDPRSQERAREKAESAQFARPEIARGLAGVRVILDAGHGGRDTGTLHGSVWESTYVYDVACRLRRILAETDARGGPHDDEGLGARVEGARPRRASQQPEPASPHATPPIHSRIRRSAST